MDVLALYQTELHSRLAGMDGFEPPTSQLSVDNPQATTRQLFRIPFLEIYDLYRRQHHSGMTTTNPRRTTHTHHSAHETLRSHCT